MRRGITVLFAGVICALSAGAAGAQELSFKFTNPSFGGNPFYADHLLAVATAQRPEKPSEDDGLSEGEQFARQIQSRILSALSSSIVEAITGSAPGTSGEFTVGDQTIFFERTLTEIRLTITDNVTGEVTTIVVPVFNFDNTGTSNAQSAQRTSESIGLSPMMPSNNSGQSGSLFSSSPLEGSSLLPNTPLVQGTGLIP
jgi:curli production assembly/transport component CsgF